MKIVTTLAVATLIAIGSSKDPGFLVRAPFCLALEKATVLNYDEYMACGLTGWEMSDLVKAWRSL
jgi:hypothetical protein